jgi:hypothetical protein
MQSQFAQCRRRAYEEPAPGKLREGCHVYDCIAC